MFEAEVEKELENQTMGGKARPTGGLLTSASQKTGMRGNQSKGTGNPNAEICQQL